LLTYSRFRTEKAIGLFLLILVFASCGNKSNSSLVNAENAKRGEKIFNYSGCLKCHSVKGESTYGPSLSLPIGSDVNVIRNGTEMTVKIDREYIVRSMKDPGFEKVIEFRNKKMAIVHLSDDDIDYITDYLIYINTISRELK
jgi:cytochrome c2